MHEVTDVGEENNDKPQVKPDEATPPEAVDMDTGSEAEQVSEPVPEPERFSEPVPEPREPEPEETPREDVFATASAPPPPAPVVTEVRKGGFFPMMLGGVVAGVIGLGAGWWLFGQDQAGNSADITAELAARDDRIASLESQLADLSDSTAALENTAASLAEGPDFAPLQTAIDEQATQSSTLAEQVAAMQSELGDTLSGLQNGVEGLEARLTDLEQAQTGTDGELSETATAAYEREIAALREETATAVEGLTARMDDTASALTAFETSIDEEIIAFKDDMTSQMASLSESTAAELEAIRAEADAVEELSEEAANAAAARAALADIRSAVETGDSFADSLTELEATGAAEVPEILAQTAETGVPTLRALRDAFPDAARDALSAARRSDDAAGPTSFLQRQFNIRSTEPREGDDPDAILSRAEAAVADGQIATALEEIAALPEPALEALSAWTAEAETRVAAQTAIDDLTATLTAN